MKYEQLKRNFNDFKKYKTFKNAPQFLNAFVDYNMIKAPAPIGDLDNKYNSMTYMPPNPAKNAIRHYYTNAKFMQKYPEDFVRELGAFKEDADQNDNKPLEDTEIDFINNEKGLALGKKYPKAPDNFLFDYIIQDIGLPLSPRNNTLYGYITND